MRLRAQVRARPGTSPWKPAPPILRLEFSKLRPREDLLNKSFRGKQKPGQLVCSYNWVERKLKDSAKSSVALCVPGDVPVYRPGHVPLPQRLTSTADIKFNLEQNIMHGQVSQVPFEALFIATEVMNPTFRFDRVDVVIPAGILNRLFRLLSFGRSTTGIQKDLIYDSYVNGYEVFTVHRTLFIRSRSRRPSPVLETYGISFERTMAPARVCFPGATNEHEESHHRALRIQLGDLNCVVLFEADARLDNGAPSDVDGHLGGHGQPLAPLGVSRPLFYSLGGYLPVFLAGSGAQQSEIVELKTRSIQSCRSHLQGQLRSRVGTEWEGQLFDWVYHQQGLGQSPDSGYGVREWHEQKTWGAHFFAQIPHCITGFHREGVLESIRRSGTAKAASRLAATKYAPDLCRLVELLHRLCDIISDQGHPCRANFQKSRDGNTRDTTSLVLTRSQEFDRQPLPRAIVERFWDQSVPDVPEEQEHSSKQPEVAEKPKHLSKQPSSNGQVTTGSTLSSAGKIPSSSTRPFSPLETVIEEVEEVKTTTRTVVRRAPSKEQPATKEDPTTTETMVRQVPGKEQPATETKAPSTNKTEPLPPQDCRLQRNLKLYPGRCYNL